MKKKIFMIMLACVMFVLCSLHCFAIAEACSHNNGYAREAFNHDEYGSGCITDERYYCDLCNETMYTVYRVMYTTCPSWH